MARLRFVEWASDTWLMVTVHRTSMRGHKMLMITVEIMWHVSAVVCMTDTHAAVLLIARGWLPASRHVLPSSVSSPPPPSFPLPHSYHACSARPFADIHRSRATPCYQDHPTRPTSPPSPQGVATGDESHDNLLTLHELGYRLMATAPPPLPRRGLGFPACLMLMKTMLILQELGYSLVATAGTASFLQGKGIKVERIFKIHEGRPNIEDSIRNGDIAMCLLTPSGDSYDVQDGKNIRRLALGLKVSCPPPPPPPSSLSLASCIQLKMENRRIAQAEVI